MRARGPRGELASRLHPFYTPETEGLRLEEWVAQTPAFSCYAFVQGGVWHERGEMGWWGVTTGDQPADVWQAAVDNMLSEIPEDHYIAVVDCHI